MLVNLITRFGCGASLIAAAYEGVHLHHWPVAVVWLFVAVAFAVWWEWYRERQAARRIAVLRAQSELRTRETQNALDRHHQRRVHDEHGEFQ